jgi:hypothetical protein
MGGPLVTVEIYFVIAEDLEARLALVAVLVLRPTVVGHIHRLTVLALWYFAEVQTLPIPGSALPALCLFVQTRHATVQDLAIGLVVLALCSYLAH